MSTSRPESPVPYIAVSAFVGIIGWAIVVLASSNLADLAGAVLAIVGGIAALVSCVAAGVEWGLARTR